MFKRIGHIWRSFSTRIMLVILLGTIAPNLQASHYMGGEITWECLANGNYRFTMRLYRDCSGVGYSGIISIHSNSPAGSILMYSWINSSVDRQDLSPICNDDSIFYHLSCADSLYGSINPNSGAIEEWTFTSDYIYPNGVQLNGIPPPSGWVFYYTDCCRNPSTNGSSGYPWFLRAVMYPYKGQNTYPCIDNSPRFSEKPVTVMCTGYPFTYNPSAFDPDLDSLSFEWAPPLLDSINHPLNAYWPGYSYTSPLPGPMHNPSNVPATINPATGEISFTSFTQGAFITVSKVASYRCGIKIAEVFREMQVVLLPCGSNIAPEVTAPFQNTNTGLYTDYTDTVYAGEHVSFYISAIDTQPVYLANGELSTITLEASGPHFGYAFTRADSGCLNPPCATLSPPPPIANQFGISVNFDWQTTCGHLLTPADCGGTTQLYNFLIKVSDDYCPVPGSAIKTISILVQDRVLEPPELRCVSVEPNGDIRLHWIPPDTSLTGNTLSKYFIYTANSPLGPYNLLDSITTWDSSEYLHQGAQANLAPRYYYLRSRSGCYGDQYSPPSDTLASIFLSQMAVSGCISNLSWNNPEAITTPPPAGTFRVYREYPLGVWTPIATTSSLFFTDTLQVCNDSVTYRIHQIGLGICERISSSSGRMIHDDLAPATPRIDSVSIAPTQDAVLLSWQPSPSPDVVGYIVLKNAGGWLPLDTLHGSANTTYSDHSPGASLCTASHQYLVLAFDSCQNISPINPALAHQTILPEVRVSDLCTGEIRVDWSHYLNFDPYMKSYALFCSIDGSTYTLLADLPAPDSLTLPQHTYVHQAQGQGQVFCYYIQAIAAATPAKSSSSCIKCVDLEKKLMPDFLYLRYASEEGEKIELCLLTDTSAATSHYLLYRAEAGQGPYQLVTTIAADTKPVLKYLDSDVTTDRQSYYYRVVAVDSCQQERLTSDTARTILLQVDPQSPFQNILQWNPYEGWQWAGVENYRVLRAQGDIQGMDYVTQLSQGPWVDDVSSLWKERGHFAYRIEAIQKEGTPDFRDTARSNTVEVVTESAIYIPNAFTPQGLNPFFRAWCSFCEPSAFRMQIFNRWGEMIFESENISQAWDGKYNGRYVPAGVYVYRIIYRDSQGMTHERRGGVRVIY